MTATLQNAPSKGESVLRLSGVSKNFGAVSALTDIELDVKAG
jgi:D-xylose transport system ATP-binding protein